MCENQRAKAQRFKSQGKKIVGYMCCSVPTEMLTALDLVPWRIHGDPREQPRAGDTLLESETCGFVRSCFDLDLRGEFDFLDGVIIPHTCDTVHRLWEMWPHRKSLRYYHCVHVPHMVDASSIEFFEKEIERFGRSLEQFTGNRLTADSLREAIKLHNANRSLLRELYDLRKHSPPLLSGTETMRMVTSGMSLPVREFSAVLRRVIAEARDHRPCQERKLPRILVYGAEIDDASFVEMIEKVGASVVIEDLCTTTRSFWQYVDEAADPWRALAVRYLLDIPCPRTYRPGGKDRQSDLEGRFGYLGDIARQFKVDGAILNVRMYCDTHELDVPEVKDYLGRLGIPSLCIEDDYRYMATSPDLPNLIVVGDTPDEVLALAPQVASALIASMKAAGDPIP